MKDQVVLSPRTPGQAAAMAAFERCDVLVLTGPAGTGKTHLAAALAAQSGAARRHDRLVLTRPQVTVAGEQMGFLPGRVEQKMHPWLLPVHDVLANVTSVKPAEWLKANAEVVPLGFVRGRTFDRCVALLDEAQNCTYAQLVAFVSRLGRHGKAVLTGDPHQSDLPGPPALLELAARLTAPPLPGVRWVTLGAEDVVRHPRLAEILDRL